MIDRIGLAFMERGKFAEWRRLNGIAYKPSAAEVDRHLVEESERERNKKHDSMCRSWSWDHRGQPKPTPEQADEALLAERRQRARDELVRSGNLDPSDADIANGVAERARRDSEWHLAIEHACAWIETHQQMHEKQLDRHYAERDAGREQVRPRDLVAVSDGAQRAGVKPEQIHYWIRRREIRVWGTAKHYRVSLAELLVRAAESEDWE